MLRNFVFPALFPILLLATNASAADMVKAKANYDRFCAACHGFNGMSTFPGTPNLRMNEGLMQMDSQVLKKLKEGSPKKPPMILMTDQELLDVITYTRTIR
jgi:mono/diheme cytochrome c family protein